MINFFLPGFYENFRIIVFLHDLMEKEPEYFFENIRIKSAYGCFPGSIWNGGRVILGSATRQEIEYVVSELNSRDIALRYTFTNPCLENIHLPDTFCNLCMDLAHNGKNEVLVNSPLLEDFLRRAYPDYAYMSSTTKCIDDKEMLISELKKDYSLIVLDSAWNNTDELFELPEKDRIELIVNHYCTDHCPRRKAHYESVGKCQLQFSDPDFPPCPFINRSFQQIRENRSFIGNDDIFGRYAGAGFCNFKLDGRGFRHEKIVESFLYYLVRPEYRGRVMELLDTELQNE